MKDCTGREYTVEDFVSFIRPFHHDMAVGRIIRFTPKCIKVLELNTAIDATGRMVAQPGKYNTEHTVRPGHATIINETADTWLYIPWAD
jgi:hypothetical protein